MHHKTHNFNENLMQLDLVDAITKSRVNAILVFQVRQSCQEICHCCFFWRLFPTNNIYNVALKLNA